MALLFTAERGPGSSETAMLPGPCDVRESMVPRIRILEGGGRREESRSGREAVVSNAPLVSRLNGLAK